MQTKPNRVQERQGQRPEKTTNGLFANPLDKRFHLLALGELNQRRGPETKAGGGWNTEEEIALASS